MECELISLYSSSSGNATLIYCAGRAVLIDCGVSFAMLKSGMEMLSRRPEDIKAVFITHEHYDHVRGLGQLLKVLRVPAYATPGTADVLCRRDGVQDINSLLGPAEAAGMCFTPVPTSHDAVESVGYRIEAGGRCAAVVTDTGYITPEVSKALEGCSLVMLESNHDKQMLLNGPYPPFLKQRILSKEGHLSNDDCAAQLSMLALKGLKKAVLAHISDKNNTPLIAKSAVINALGMYGIGPGDFELYAAGERPVAVKL